MHTCEFNFGKPGVDTWQVGHVQFKLLPLFVQACFFCHLCLHLDVRSLLCGRGTGRDILGNQLHLGYCRIWDSLINSWYSLHLSFDGVISLIHNIQDLSLFRDGTLMKRTVTLWHILQGNKERTLVYRVDYPNDSQKQKDSCVWLVWSNQGQVTWRFRKLRCWYVSQLGGCRLCSCVRLHIWLHLGTFWTSFRFTFTPIKPAWNVEQKVNITISANGSNVRQRCSLAANVRKRCIRKITRI